MGLKNWNEGQHFSIGKKLSNSLAKSKKTVENDNQGRKEYLYIWTKKIKYLSDSLLKNNICPHTHTHTYIYIYVCVYIYINDMVYFIYKECSISVLQHIMMYVWRYSWSWCCNQMVKKKFVWVARSLIIRSGQIVLKPGIPSLSWQKHLKLVNSASRTTKILQNFWLTIVLSIKIKSFNQNLLCYYQCLSRFVSLMVLIIFYINR